MILKHWVTCAENSMALVGFLLAPSVPAKSTSSAEPAILNSLTARNAALWVKPPTNTVRGHLGGIKKFHHNRLWQNFSKFQAFLQQMNKKP